MIALYFISLLFQATLIDVVGQSGNMPSEISLKIINPTLGLVNVEGKQNGSLKNLFQSK